MSKQKINKHITLEYESKELTTRYFNTIRDDENKQNNAELVVTVGSEKVNGVK